MLFVLLVLQAIEMSTETLLLFSSAPESAGDTSNLLPLTSLAVSAATVVDVSATSQYNSIQCTKVRFVRQIDQTLLSGSGSDPTGSSTVTEGYVNQLVSVYLLFSPVGNELQIEFHLAGCS